MLLENCYVYFLAENVASKWNVSREEQDRFATKSQNKCQLAQENGHFNEEIVPITVKHKKGITEHFRVKAPRKKLFVWRRHLAIFELQREEPTVCFRSNDQIPSA